MARSQSTIRHAELSLRTLADYTARFSRCLERTDQGVAGAVHMAHEALDEALLRLRVAFPSKTDDSEDDPLVFGVQAGIGADERLDGGA